MQKNNHLPHIFIGTVFLTTLAFWPWNWLGFSLPKHLILSTGLSICFLLWAWQRKNMKLWQKQTWPVWAYFGLMIIYTLFSTTPLLSFLGPSSMHWGLATQLLYLGVFLLSINMSSTKWRTMILWLNIIVASYALIQFARLDPLQWFWEEEKFLYRSFSTLGNPNWLASFLALTFPVVFYQINRNESSVETRLIASLQKWGIITLNLLALISTGSKAGFLGALFLTIIILKNKTKHWKKGVVVLFMAAVLGLIYFYSDGWALTRSLGSRLHIWQGAWQAFLAQPWGYGLDTFWLTFPTFSGVELWATEGLNVVITHPHNLILEKLLEIGPWGLLLFGWMIFIALKKGWKDDEKKWMAYGIIAHLITLMFGFETLGTGVLFWLFMGSLFYEKSDLAGKIHPWQHWATGAFGLLFLGLTLLNIQHVRANVFYEWGKNQLDASYTRSALINLQKAAEIYPYDRVYLLQSAELLLALQGEKVEHLDQAELYLEQVSFLTQGNDKELPIFYAWLNAEWGELESFEQELSKGFEVNPALGNNYKIGLHIYQKLGWENEYEALKKQFYEQLPDHWNKPGTTPGRIFQKNHPWVMEI